MPVSAGGEWLRCSRVRQWWIICGVINLDLANLYHNDCFAPTRQEVKAKEANCLSGQLKGCEKNRGMKVYKMGPVTIVKLWAYGAHITSPKENGLSGVISPLVKRGAITLFITGRGSSSTTVNTLGSWKKWISKIFYGILFQGGFIVAMNKPQVETTTQFVFKKLVVQLFNSSGEIPNRKVRARGKTAKRTRHIWAVVKSLVGCFIKGMLVLYVDPYQSTSMGVS